MFYRNNNSPVIGVTEHGDAGRNLLWVKSILNDTVKGGVLITKTITLEFGKAVLACPKPLIIHCTVTGWGGSAMEPGAFPFHVQLDALEQLVEAGFPASHCVIRIDPIIPLQRTSDKIPFDNGTKLVCDVLSYLYSKPLLNEARIRVSIVDDYPTTKKRFRAKGWETIYPDTFPGETRTDRNGNQYTVTGKYADEERTKQVLKTLQAWYNGRPFYTCAEDQLYQMSVKYGLEGLIIPTGCVSRQDAEIMGIVDQFDWSVLGENGQNRFGCHCLGCKKELLDYKCKQPCPNGCVYCFWQGDHMVNPPKATPFTRSVVLTPPAEPLPLKEEVYPVPDTTNQEDDIPDAKINKHGKVLLTRINDIKQTIKEYHPDEIWYIVRSFKGTLPPNVKQVQALSPSFDLLTKYTNLKKAGNWNEKTFKEIYVPQFLKEMGSPEAIAAFNNIETLVCKEDKTIALACFCEDETLCHRSIVGGILMEKGTAEKPVKVYKADGWYASEYVHYGTDFMTEIIGAEVFDPTQCETCSDKEAELAVYYDALEREEYFDNLEQQQLEEYQEVYEVPEEAFVEPTPEQKPKPVELAPVATPVSCTQPEKEEQVMIKKPFYLLVAGTRSFNDEEALEDALNFVLSKKVQDHNIIIVEGAARGADTMAKQYAIRHGLKFKEFPAQWERYKGTGKNGGNPAGFIRNREMHQFIADNAAPEDRGCICFWDGMSKGTQDNFHLCKELGTKLVVFDYLNSQFIHPIE